MVRGNFVLTACLFKGFRNLCFSNEDRLIVFLKPNLVI